MKILVVGRVLTFIDDMMDAWIKEGYEVTVNGEYYPEEAKDKDIIFCEFVDNRLEKVASCPIGSKKKIIARLHRIEWYKGQPRSGINWENVNYLVFTGRYFYDMFMLGTRKTVTKSCKVLHIPYGIDLERFTYKERKPGLNIVWVAKSLWIRKDPVHAISLVYGLRKKSGLDYKLFIVGAGGDSGVQHHLNYLKWIRPELKDFVTFTGYIPDRKMNDFLEDKNFSLVTSVNESFCFAVGEPMAKGIKTMLWDFEPANTLWPRKYTFFSDQEFFDLIEGPYESQKYRDYIKIHYSLEAQLEAFRSLF